MFLKCFRAISKAEWNDEIIIFHHQSGDTHLFSGIEKEIVSFCLSHDNFNVADLFTGYGDYFYDSQQAESYISALLNILIRKNFLVSDCGESDR